MMHSKRTLPLIAVAFAALAGACSTTSGEPEPTTTPRTSTSSPGQTSSPQQAGNPFKGMVACDLLDKALKAAEKSFPPGEYSDIGSDNGCQASKPSVASFSLTFHPGRSLDTFGHDKTILHNGKVDGRPAVQKRGGLGSDTSCSIAISVKPESYAVVGVTRLTGTTEQACNSLEQVVPEVAPMLP